VSDLLAAVPMAIVMVAAPQIISAVFLATSDQARRNSVAFLLGVALATTTGTTIVYLTAGSVADPSAESSGNDAIDYVVIAYAPAGAGLPQETETKPPAWMGKLQTANARFAFRLGLLLFLLMPTDIITMFAVGGYLGRYVNPWWHTLLFVGLTLLLAGAPLLILLLLGKRADVLLPKMRDWMQANRGS
jgi:hypothetical protein